MPALASRNFARYLGDGVLNVTLTTPFDGEIILTATPTMVWTFAPGTQNTFRFRIWDDEAQTILVYDSGVIASPILSHLLPEGAIDTGKTYFAQVDITTTLGAPGQSDLNEFTTVFATSVDVTGVVILLVGDECDRDFQSLPCVKITWDQVVPAEAEEFVQYDIRRQGPDDIVPVRIAIIPGPVFGNAATNYEDYAGVPGTQYSYTILWRATVAGIPVVSSPQDPAPIATLSFPWLFIHAVATPGTFVRYDSFTHALQEDLNVSFVRTWGRSKPVAQIGEAQSLIVTVPGRPALTPARRPWDGVVDLISTQRSQSSTLVARFGRQQRLVFCVMNAASRDDGQKSYSLSIALTETFFQEAV